MTVETKNEDGMSVDSDKVNPSAQEQADKPKHEKIDRITALQDAIGKPRTELRVVLSAFMSCWISNLFLQKHLLLINSDR